MHHTLKLAEWRQFRGLTKSALAARAGVGFQTIWRMESGRSRSPQRGTVARLAAALDAEPRHLWATPPLADAADDSQSFTRERLATGDVAKILSDAG